jgi:ubiquinone/menaquinone biosynthesis C-methylase UbiE
VVAGKVFWLNIGLAGMEKYLQSCKTEFWKNVFKAEMDYILRELNGAEDVLSIGCGPAIVEAGLVEHGFNITGLDISKEALGYAPDTVRTVIGPAEKMDFADSSFDAVIYIASLQFIENYKQAVKQTARVLKPGGKLLVMLLNPQSQFYKEKVSNPTSYVSKIKHTDLREIERAVADYFLIQTEYFLGIKGQQILESQQPDLAALYVIKGKKKD